VTHVETAMNVFRRVPYVTVMSLCGLVGLTLGILAGGSPKEIMGSTLAGGVIFGGIFSIFIDESTY
jgi:multidrug efflux pump subunit AcrB